MAVPAHPGRQNTAAYGLISLRMPMPRDLGVLAVKSGHLGIWCYEKLRSCRKSAELRARWLLLLHLLWCFCLSACGLRAGLTPASGCVLQVPTAPEPGGGPWLHLGRFSLLETVCPLPQHNIDHREVSELCVCPEVAALPWWHPEPSSW